MGKFATGRRLRYLSGAFIAMLAGGVSQASACDDDYCDRYRYRPRVYYYTPSWNDIYHPRELPPLRPGDNGMLPGVNPRQEWFNKHGTTGYSYYGYYGYGVGYYNSYYGYPYRRAYRARSDCGRYRYWNGDYCADARWERPSYRHARYW